MKYKEENIEEARKRLISALLNEALIIDACRNMLANPELVNISALEFAQIIMNTINASWEEMKKRNAYACKLTELAVEQIFTQGYISKECPIKRIK